MDAVGRQQRSVRVVNYNERSNEGMLTMKERKEMGKGMYEVRKQDGMGNGLVTTRDVEVGEMISEYASMFITIHTIHTLKLQYLHAISPPT
jgi:hypothetical protein